MNCSSAHILKWEAMFLALPIHMHSLYYVLYCSICELCTALCVLFPLLVPSVVLTIFLGLISSLMTLAQLLFQISLATGYDDNLEPCEDNSVLTAICVGVELTMKIQYDDYTSRL